jgi:hypothetical protein
MTQRGNIFHVILAHIGYLVPLTKMADFLSAGVEVSDQPICCSPLTTFSPFTSQCLQVTILLAGKHLFGIMPVCCLTSKLKIDVHSFLDNLKAPIELVRH